MSMFNEPSGLPIVSTKVEIGAYEAKLNADSWSIGTGQMHSFLLITQTDIVGNKEQKFLYFGPDKTNGDEASVYPTNPENAKNWHYGSAYDVIKAGNNSYEADDSTLFHEYNFTKGEQIRAVYGDYQGSYEQDQAEHFVTIAEGSQYNGIADKLLESAENLVGSGYRYSALNYNSNDSLATVLEDNGLEWQAPDGGVYPGIESRIPLSDAPAVPVVSLHVPANPNISQTTEDPIEISIADVATPIVEVVGKLNPINSLLPEKAKNNLEKASSAVAKFVDDAFYNVKTTPERAGNSPEKNADEGGAFSKLYDAVSNTVKETKDSQPDPVYNIESVRDETTPQDGFFERFGRGLGKVAQGVATVYKGTTAAIDDFVVPIISATKYGEAASAAYKLITEVAVPTVREAVVAVYEVGTKLAVPLAVDAVSLAYKGAVKVGAPIVNGAIKVAGGAVNKIKSWSKKNDVEEDTAHEAATSSDIVAEKPGFFKKISSGFAKVGESIKSWGKKSAVEDSVHETTSPADVVAEKPGLIEKIGSGFAKITETVSKIPANVSKTVESLPVVGSVVGAVKSWGKKSVVEEPTQDSYLASQSLDHEGAFDSQMSYYTSHSHEDTYQPLPII